MRVIHMERQSQRDLRHILRYGVIQGMCIWGMGYYIQTTWRLFRMSHRKGNCSLMDPLHSKPSLVLIKKLNSEL